MEIKSEVMVNWLHQQQLEMMFTNGGRDEGVILKKVRDNYISCPSDLSEERGGLFDAIRKLNVKVSFLGSDCCRDSRAYGLN